MNSECFKRELCLLFFTITIGNNLVAQKKVEVDFNISAGNSKTTFEFVNNSKNTLYTRDLGKFNLNLRISTPVYYFKRFNKKTQSHISLGAGMGGLISIDGTGNEAGNGTLSAANYTSLNNLYSVKINDGIKYFYPFTFIRLEYQLKKTSIFGELLYSVYNSNLRVKVKSQTLMPLINGDGIGIGIGLKFRNRITIGVKKEFINFPQSKIFAANFDISSINLGLPFN
jgi:hypothetical protein